MKKLSPNAHKWLKCFHVLAAGVWIGTSLSLSAKQFFINPTREGELYGILSTLDFVDLCVLVPGAIGTLITGIIYSVWTNWGWFRHRFITVKWIICLFGVSFGTYPLGPWLSGMVRISGEQGLASFTNPTFMHNRSMLLIFGTFQCPTLLFAYFLSVLKPWKRRGK